MSLAGLGRFEWVLIELLVLGILVWQLVSVRRLIRRDRQAAQQAKAQEAETD